MKNTKLLLAIATSAALLTGCQNTHGIDTNMAISSGLNAYKAATLSDADAKAIANQGCAEMDSGNQVASKSSKYGKRLAKIELLRRKASKIFRFNLRLLSLRYL